MLGRDYVQLLDDLPDDEDREVAARMLTLRFCVNEDVSIPDLVAEVGNLVSISAFAQSYSMQAFYDKALVYLVDAVRFLDDDVFAFDTVIDATA